MSRETGYIVDWGKCDLNDFSKLRRSDGRILFRLYRQDGTMQDMDCADTQENRLTVSWFQIHDRYTVRETETGAEGSDKG